MSDEEDYYDDDYEYFEYEEDGYNAVDDLAEHTMHSPVLIGHDPDFDFLDYDGDWDDSADDFYEEATKTRTKKRQRAPGIESPRPRKKKRGLTSENPASLCEPVVWIPLSLSIHPPVLPKREQNGAEAVALLKDWRDQLTGPSPWARLGKESSLPYVPSQSTTRLGDNGTKRKRGMSESSETTEGQAGAESAKSLNLPKRKAMKQATAALEQSKVSVREDATDSRQDSGVSRRKLHHRPGQVLQEVRLPPAALTDGQGNANRRGRPPSKGKATIEEQSKNKGLAATKPHAVTKLNRASGRQTRSRK